MDKYPCRWGGFLWCSVSLSECSIRATLLWFAGGQRFWCQNHEPNHFIGLASSLASLSFLTGSAHHSFDIFPVEFCSLFCFWGGFLQPRMTWQKLLSKSLTQRFVLFCSSLMKTMRFEMVAWPWAEVIFVEHSLQKLSLRVFLFSSWRWCSR